MAIYFDISSLDIDSDALINSEKYLTVIFMALIGAANATLLFKVICRGRYMVPIDASTTRTRCCIRMSLAVGGLLLAFFSFLVYSVLVFKQKDHGLNCLTGNLARIYANEFLPVLYACGLLLLAIDVISQSQIDSTSSMIKHRQKQQQSVIFPAFCFVLPWVVSLVVVCPLTLTATEWDNCKIEQSKLQTRARIVVCNLIPALLALISGVCTLQCRKTTTGSDESSEDRKEYPSYQGEGHIYAIGNNFTDLPEHNADGNETLTESCYLGYSKHTGKPGQLPYTFSTYGNKHSPTETQALEEPSCQNNKLIVFISCVVFIIAIVPFNAICLYIMDNYDNLDGNSAFVYKVETSLYITIEVVSWLQSVYPVALPILWTMVPL